jgi:hypothetical protein
MMEFKIGSILEVDGVKVRVVEGRVCTNCVFFDISEYKCRRPENISGAELWFCSKRFREDGKSIIYEKIDEGIKWGGIK